MSEGEDRRQHSRFEVGMALKIANGTRRIPSKVIDVSVGGAKILWQDTLQSAQSAIAAGQFVELEIAKNIIVDARVVRIDDDIVCVRFEVADDELNHVSDALSAAIGHKLIGS